MKKLQNTTTGRNTWNEQHELFFPGELSMTEAKIYQWVVLNHGRAEAQRPTWNIHLLAQYLDSTKRAELAKPKVGYVSYECISKEYADAFNDVYPCHPKERDDEIDDTDKKTVKRWDMNT